MCGISSIVSYKQNIKEDYNTSRILETLNKRGPDSSGEHLYPLCWLGHTRLSIIDLEGGYQPMIDDDDQYAIVFNGEIYNYKEIKNDLIKKGVKFRTKSDTEVILKLYKIFGKDCVKHLDGMFAFSIWDNKNEQLFIARDRFGKKPLFYSLTKDGIVCASEIKAIIATGKIKKEISKESLDNYLRLMYIPSWKSIYKNIDQLPSAHIGIFKNNKLEIERYWKLEYKKIDIEYEVAKKETERLIRESVKKRMLASDVEVGAFLSGGVDSSLISIIASEFLNKPLKTFSLGYEDYINELPFAEKVSKQIHSSHFTLQAQSQNIKDLEDIIEYFDEPHADTSNFPQSRLSKLASEKVKVALSGDGGDEIFFGYGWYMRHKHLSYKKHTIEKLVNNPFWSRVRNSEVFPLMYRKFLWGSLYNTNDNIYDTKLYEHINDPITKINIFDLSTYLPGQLLSKVDRTSMMHSLEVRCPFLDTKLVQFVSSLPNEFKLKNGEHKYILKDILLKYLPKDFVFRKKQGFGAPTKKWLREEEMKKYVLNMLGENAMIRSVFNGLAISFILNRFYDHQKDNEAMRVWTLLCLEIWFRKNKPLF